MFDSLTTPNQDPILSLAARFAEDNRTHKIDLGIGAYRNQAGITPIMAAIQQAAIELAHDQTSKGYLGLAGNEHFNQSMKASLLTGTHAFDRCSAIQTPGASGALRLLAELIASVKPNARVWLSDPSYVNHQPIMAAAGLGIGVYPYFNPDSKMVDEAAMLEQISKLGHDDVLLLHGCCHNPTGADISLSAWQQITDMSLKQGFLPFIDLAYQGFGQGLKEDIRGLRIMAEAVPELLITVSCSKNFGLYRERTGAALVVGSSLSASNKAKLHLQGLARTTYTMPPDHGAALVVKVLQEPRLKRLWQSELTEMLERVQSLRKALVAEFRKVSQSERFDYFDKHLGMFSATGLTPPQIEQLQRQAGVYIVSDGRINIAGLNHDQIPTLVTAFIAAGA